MLKRYSANFTLFSIYLDWLITFLALWLVLHMKPILAVYSDLTLRGLSYLVIPTIWVMINLFIALYDNKCNVRFIGEVLRLLSASMLASLILAGIAFFFEHQMPRSSFVLFILIGASLQLVWRVMVRFYWRILPRREEIQRRVLILGAGDTGQKIAHALRQQADVHPPIICYLDDDIKKQTQPDVLGPISALHNVLTRYPAEDIIIALPLKAHDQITEAALSVRTRPVNLWLVPASYRLALYHPTVEDLSGIPLLDLRAPAITPQQRLAKRAFDVIFSGLMLILLSIPMLVIAVLIKLDSPGPILFRQKRIGENDKPFEMLKFRSMVQNAESLLHRVEKIDENGNLIHKSKEDPRVTRAGRFLRKTSLDELPQFINVLKGEMSVVGPRPELPYLVEKYNPWQHIRFTVPPGITGWWQVSGRSDCPMHLNTEKDIFYIKNYSFWLDLKILFRTVWVVLYGNGAF
jgi:exopolysaccharide biosynthesis polyprenyl glycosylphosphotransferase